jgi:hypothetical protein
VTYFNRLAAGQISAYPGEPSGKRTVPESRYPMHDCSPQVDPSNKLQVVGSIRSTFDDIVNDFIEYGDRSSNTTD